MTHEYKHYIDLSQFEGHTPGPWEINPVNRLMSESSFIVHRETGCKYVALVMVCGGKYDYSKSSDGSGPRDIPAAEHDANARLMAATPMILAYARELEARVKELEIRDVSATHMIMEADFKKHEMSLRIADLERQLAEATTWRSPETAPKDGTWFIGYYDTDKILGTRADTMCDKDDEYLWITNEGFMVKRKTLVGWLPLPETKKEEV